MKLLLTTLYCALVTGAVVAIQKCDDCLSVTDCAPAYEQLYVNPTPDARALLSSAFCGMDIANGGMLKVCCSHYLTNRFYNEDSTTDIENHPNVNLLPDACGDILGNRIIGGTVADINEFPWLALIKYKDGGSFKFKCGGTVITSRYVLTAAHCIVGEKINGVRIGEYDLSKETFCTEVGEWKECESTYQDIEVSHVISHPSYRKSPVVINDIGLLRLAKNIDFSGPSAAAICLPITKTLLENNVDNEVGVVAGWGMTEKNKNSDILLKTSLTVHSGRSCDYNRNHKDLMKNTICAGGKDRDTCKGDSGGPLMIEYSYKDLYKYVQYGIVSYGSSVCGSGTLGIYTDVRKYMKWILDTIKP